MPFMSDFRSGLLSGAAAVLAFAGSSAHAQTADAPPASLTEVASAEDGGTITVTGLRQQYRGDVPLKELPQSIQTLSGETLREVNLTRLDTALDFASGVSRQNNFGGLFDAFALRGFAGDENTASNYLVNGFNASRGYGGIRDTSNIERMEVLKGPSSALFGRGEPGGTVNIITKKPQFDAFGLNATVGYGRFDTYRAEGDVNVPLAGNLAVRVTGAYENADSFRDFIESEKYTVTPSILWKPAPDTTVSYELEYIHQAVPFDRGIVAVNGDPKALSRKTFLGEPGDGDTEVEALGHQFQLQHSFSRDWNMSFGAGYRDTSFTGFSSDAELVDGRQPFYNNNSFTTTRILSRQRRFRDYGTKDLVFRGELSGKIYTGPFTHHLLVGADWDYYKLDVLQNRFRPGTGANALTTASTQAMLNTFNAINVFNPVYGNLPAVGAFQNQRERQYSWGVYFQDQIDLTDALKVRVGGRYDDVEQTLNFRVPGTNGALPAVAKQDKTKFSPQVGVSYEISEAFSLYASYGKGFRFNTGTGAPNAAGVSTLFEPETTKSVEVGGKFALFDDMLTGTVALFETKKNNVLTADPANPGFSQGLGKARSRGVEFDATGQLPAGFRVTIAYAYLDAEVRTAAADPNFGFQLRVGDPLINIPKNSGSVLLFKDIEFGEQKLTLGAGVNYVGKRLGETGYRFPDGSFFTLPSYTLTRVSAAFEVNEHIRVSGEVTNLFDEKYFPSSYSRLWLTPGTPRSWMVRVGYKL
ncbi:TonB-dependent siderophore receptor [Sphingomonas solaris]|uniref:TonB-dependent receptor n=1 Tax=Alterirhizorhabdus solaris TaxID=2529389 RepID=A0A558R8X4_9SPHN|nr:TonB-dependent receptor [Sphingomonas solaris]TVV75817.1 TonB-dependent receptor [Sphingomonas solaris]